MKINRIKKLIIYLEVVLIEFGDRLNLSREVNDSEYQGYCPDFQHEHLAREKTISWILEHCKGIWYGVGQNNVESNSEIQILQIIQIEIAVYNSELWV